MHIVPQHAGTPILANQRKASQGMARLCIAPNGFSFPRQYVGENTSQRRAESYMPVLLENVIPSQIKSFAFRNNLFHIMQVLSLLHSGRVINREKFFFLTSQMSCFRENFRIRVTSLVRDIYGGSIVPFCEDEK